LDFCSAVSASIKISSPPDIDVFVAKITDALLNSSVDLAFLRYYALFATVEYEKTVY